MAVYQEIHSMRIDYATTVRELRHMVDNAYELYGPNAKVEFDPKGTHGAVLRVVKVRPIPEPITDKDENYQGDDEALTPKSESDDEDDEFPSKDGKVELWA